MKTKRYIATLAMLLLMAAPALAEDGELFVKDISKTPDLDTNHAALCVLYKNVLARNSSGEPAPVTYTAKDGSEFTNDYVRPLIAMYHDGPVVNPEDSGEFPGHGQRDVFGAVSLDDGNTFIRSNLSNSGDKSSFTLKDHTTYYGDTFRLFTNSAGTKVMAAWASRYANGGNPNYAMSDTDREALAAYLGIDRTDAGFDLYVDDIWGVTGSQGSSDFADEGFPSVGEVPYATLWTCRGTLEDTDGDGKYDAVVWRQAERLTSGRRDVHRIEVGVAGGAGFVVTWQEDPDGLRPGTGEGPGEGWSGAVAHHQTDIWYSYIDWEMFDLVNGGDNPATGDITETFNPIPLDDYTPATTPAVGIPMSMPVRLTDNAMGLAKPDDYDPIEEPSYLYELDQNGNDTPDLCEKTVKVTVEVPDSTNNPPTSTTPMDLQMCVAEDGRLMRGNTGATRNRVNLRGYDTDGDGAFDEAWVVMAYEESKGLGEELDYDPGELIEKVDMGKNIWYHSFDMRNPELVSQGMMLNMPAVYPDGTPVVQTENRLVEYPQQAVSADGNISYNYRFMHIEPDPIYEEQPETAIPTVLLQTEIARRFSLISQPAKDAGPSGTVALATWKQGIIRQGGPADVYGRRFIIPEEFNAAVDNPFGYDCMECATKLFTDGSNPRYVKGLCISPPEALSASMPFDVPDIGGEASSMGNNIPALIAAFPFNEAFDDIDMALLPEDVEQMPKVYEWQQLGADYGQVITDTLLTNLDDQSWENPYDVAKGHRGFISGDFIMLLYAWSPNWLANTWGHDNYNLYVRRSFDGGVTWTTLPTGWTDTQNLPSTTTLVADGTKFYEWMGPAGTTTEYKVEFDLIAGQFEPTRSMSMLNGLKETVLDPRYAPTGGPTHSSILDADGNIDDPNLDGESERDPSKFFITFEVGDNTLSEFGEAPPQDMYYSRATNYGDDYEYVWDETIAVDDGAGGLTYDLTSNTNEGYFDWLEGKEDTHAAEASMHASPGGKFFWAVWEQWKEDADGEAYDTDAPLRRLMFLDGEIEDTEDPNQGPGDDVGPPSGDDPTPPRPGKR
ncbi:MAG: hypothetical protein KJ804_22480 [Proteobacteria bacterium]|nr:hypothetical protein [Pseudomonadota bacterium]